MENPLLLSEVAKLYQRDVVNEVALRQMTNQANTTKISRPGMVKRFVMLSFSLNKIVLRLKQEKLSLDDGCPLGQ